jgi:cobalt-precorrin 5A hydrolase / precorrin-3B C17-methyltransferase
VTEPPPPGGAETAAAPKVVTLCLTAAGAALADRLPFPHHRGDLAERVRALWPRVDGLVLVCATGIAVRVIGPLLADKHVDPAVVCVDDQGRWAIALAGGHRGANDLAVHVAGLVGAEPVVTTATDGADVPALDTLVGFRAEGDVAGVTSAWLDGHPPGMTVDRDALPQWPLPSALAELSSEPASASAVQTQLPQADPPAESGGLVQVTDRVVDPVRGEVLLRPASLVVGVGSSSGADPAGIADLVARALLDAGLSPAAVGVVASVDLKRTEPGIVALAERFGVALRTFPASTLSAMEVPNPSPVVDAAVGTPSVAEAAALAAAGPGASLVVPKLASADATAAVARRRRPEGHLAVVGLGPGDPGWCTPAAAAAVRAAELVVGYGPYVEQAAELLRSSQEVVRSPIGAEAERCRLALDAAARGRQVALVCSGDPGVFALASLVCELAPDHGHPEVTIVPGVTAASGGAALLGAPLGHDHAAVSLSDLLTPWTVIEQRLTAVAEGDLAVALYNPRSGRRTWQLGRALEILAAHRPAGCPVAVLSDVGRPGQRVLRTTLGGFGEEAVQATDMVSLVIVGSSTTRWIGDRMVTPRGYPSKASAGAATAARGPDGRLDAATARTGS